ncbi:MAG: DEAD/DEAH box helicase, partial [Planctomycetota bacterium]
MAEAQVLADGTGTLRSLVEWLAQHAHVDQTQAALTRGESVTWDGAVGSSCALGLAALMRRLDSGLLIVCPTASGLESLAEDLESLVDEPLSCFPAWENAIGQRLVYDDVYADRLRTLKRLLAEPAQPLVLTSVHAWLQPTPVPEAIRANSLRLSTGQQLDVNEVSRWLVQHGFQQVSGVELPGEFAVRGGIVDLFAPAWDDPVRMEWFDEQIESIRRFDVGTQRTIETLDAADVTVLPSGGDDPMRASQVRSQLTAFLPAGTCVVFLEPDALRQEAQKLLAEEDHETLASFESTCAAVADWPRLDLAALASSPHPTTVRLPLGSVEQFQGDAKEVRSQLDKSCTDSTVTLLCANDGEQQRLGEYFQETQLATTERLRLEIGTLNEGFRVPELDLVVLSGAQLFGRQDLKRRRRRRHLGKKIDTFLDLRDGDLVVHLSHGVGRYRGLEMLRRENQLEEHLVIEFRGGTKIFVPATKIDLVQKYVGGGKARPRLATIGGRLWQQRKKAATLAVTDLAAELLELQAKRAARPGIAFAADTEWQREFDTSFPYEETEDQLAAIEAIKADMEHGRPMDRLLCGDVGFGKTEVAMRAAFKAVDNGYQVAVLVPTTILAEQHYRSFRERISEFPFDIAKLSRFATAAEQRETVTDIATGKVDIVIGTHRLASKDVKFENLGLLIIDEEQRFGVEIKERLKTMRATIDVLTMTATPIPRTLHMSMTGLREISNLESPPEDRVSVETRVTRWDDDLIRHAILREFHRGGQVYFVHNRVQDIMTLRAKLEAIVPEVRISVGHGQMPEGALEEVMVDFV